MLNWSPSFRVNDKQAAPVTDPRPAEQCCLCRTLFSGPQPCQGRAENAPPPAGLPLDRNYGDSCFNYQLRTPPAALECPRGVRGGGRKGCLRGSWRLEECGARSQTSDIVYQMEIRSESLAQEGQVHVKIEWQEPIQLTYNKKIKVTIKELAETIESRPGVYFFSRKFGHAFEPFYIGETKSILGRLKSHLKNKDIAYALEGLGGTPVKGGARYFHYGYLDHSTSDPKKYLDIVQRYLIRQAIAGGCNVLNKNLTTKKFHTIEFNGSALGRAIFPKSANIETK